LTTLREREVSLWGVIFEVWGVEISKLYCTLYCTMDSGGLDVDGYIGRRWWGSEFLNLLLIQTANLSPQVI
jgi:hypothetical protein